MHRVFLCGLLLFAVTVVPVAAGAVDGRLEVHPACVAVGCFPGDGPGFPIQITAPGSYVLTGNLVVGVAAHAILVTADDVHLDLGGFLLRGPATCDSSGCSATGFDRGVSISGAERLTLRNGSITGFPNQAVVSGTASEVVGIIASGNGAGISTGSFSRVTGNRVFGNANGGITASGLISDNIVRDNGGAGMSTSNAIVRDNLVERNGQQGIFASRSAFDDSSLITGNTILRNVGAGIHFNGAAGWGGNVLSGNNGGNANPQTTGTGSPQIAPNQCGSSLTCP